MTPALRRFCDGIFFIALALIFAYLTQLRLYNEELARHTDKKFKTWHPYLLAMAIGLAFTPVAFFIWGCMIAASVLGKIRKLQWKFYAVERFKCILDLTVKNADKSRSAIPD